MCVELSVEARVAADHLGEEEEVGLGEDLGQLQQVVAVGVGAAHQVDRLVARPVRVLWVQEVDNLASETRRESGPDTHKVSWDLLVRHAVLVLVQDELELCLPETDLLLVQVSVGVPGVLSLGQLAVTVAVVLLHHLLHPLRGTITTTAALSTTHLGQQAVAGLRVLETEELVDVDSLGVAARGLAPRRLHLGHGLPHLAVVSQKVPSGCS